MCVFQLNLVPRCKKSYSTEVLHGDAAIFVFPIEQVNKWVGIDIVLDRSILDQYYNNGQYRIDGVLASIREERLIISILYLDGHGSMAARCTQMNAVFQEESEPAGVGNRGGFVYK